MKLIRILEKCQFLPGYISMLSHRVYYFLFLSLRVENAWLKFYLIETADGPSGKSLTLHRHFPNCYVFLFPSAVGDRKLFSGSAWS
jgi:hypothetical protein